MVVRLHGMPCGLGDSSHRGRGRGRRSSRNSGCGARMLPMVHNLPYLDVNLGLISHVYGIFQIEL